MTPGFGFRRGFGFGGRRGGGGEPPLIPVTINSRHFGDSITESNAGGPGDGWVARLSNWMDGTQDNLGVGGQTSVQITDRVQAQTSGQLAQMHTLMQGTNNSTAVTTILADYADADTAITGPLLVLGPIGSGNMLGTMGLLNRVSDSLRATYGDNFLDIQHAFRRQGPFTGTELRQVRAGTLPSSLMADATHPSNALAGPLMAEEIGRAMRALSGTAEPFVHDDLVTWSSAASVNSVIHTARKLGTVDTWSFVSDESDDLFRINASGQILRGAGTDYPESGIRAVQVRGQNANGRHTGRLLMAREAETDQPIYPVRISGEGSILTRRLAAGESFPFMDNGTQISIVMLVRFDDVIANGALFTTAALYNMTGTNGQMRFFARDPAGAQLGTANISTPAVTDKGEWHWLMLSYDSSANVARAVSVSAANGAQVNSTIAGTVTAGTLGLARIDGLFTNNSGDTAPWKGDLKMLWVAPTYIDFGSSAERDRFFNSTTLEPVTMAADGVVNSISPAIYMRGRMGDWLKGRNFAPSGAQLFAPFPIDENNAVITEPFEPLAAPVISDVSISGTASDGQTLTANYTITGNPLPTPTVEWEDGALVDIGTGNTILLDAASMGLAPDEVITLRVRATNSEGTDEATATITFGAPAAGTLVMPTPVAYFLSPSTLGASTTRLTFRVKLKLPSITNGMMIFSGASDPVRIAVNTDGSVQAIVEDSGGTNVVNNVTIAPAGTIVTGTEQDIVFDANHATQLARLTVDGVNYDASFSTAGTGTFGSGRTISMLASSTGTNALPTNTEFRDLSVDRNGTLLKAISNSAATANADAWKQGSGSFTNV